MPNKSGSRRSPCPHCKKVTLTVDGVCAQCWGMKSNRPFPWRRGQLVRDGDAADDVIRSETHRYGGDLVDDVILWGCCWWPAFASAALVVSGVVLLLGLWI